MQDSKRDTDVYNSLLDFVREGEDGMIWENGIVTCIISYKKRTHFLCLLHWQEGSLALTPPRKPREICIMSYMIENLKVCKTEADCIICEIT